MATKKRKLMKVRVPPKSKREILASRILELIEDFSEEYHGDIQSDLGDRVYPAECAGKVPSSEEIVQYMIDRALDQF